VTGILLFALSSTPIWWWLAGIGIIALVLISLGRSAARPKIAGEITPDQGPDLKAAETRQTPDIRPDDENQTPSTS